MITSILTTAIPISFVRNSGLTEAIRPTTLPEVPLKFRFFMRSIVVKPRFLPAILSVGVGLFFLAEAQASGLPAKNGSVILSMCQSADSVKTLFVMCHSYLDGYIDAAHHYEKGKPAFCLDDADKQKAPKALVAWIGAHPESLTQPAGEVMQKALTAHFPCKGRK